MNENTGAAAILAVYTYGSQRVKDRAGHTVSAYKIGYTSAASDLLLALYGNKARNVSSRQASYRYIQIDGAVMVRHGYLLLKLNADELARAEHIARGHHRAGAYLWREGKWHELPTSRSAAYVEASSGPGFDPTGFLPVAPSSGEKESAAQGIRVEKSQRDPNDRPWWWILGETYPHRELLKRHGARFSGRRRAWYWVGWELPDDIRQLVDEVEETKVDAPAAGTIADNTPVLSPELERQILDVLAQEDAMQQASPAPLETPSANLQHEAVASTADEKPPAVRITRPAPLPTDGTLLDPVQKAVHQTRTLPTPSPAEPHTLFKLRAIAQAYCGELTGSISGQVFCYGYAVHDGICIYVNMAGPRVAVEAIRAKLSKGDQVSVVPLDAPSVELTAGEGHSGMYHAYLHYLPEARFASLILVHDWAVTPNYGGKATTFIFCTSEAQAMAKLKHHLTQLVNIPVFEAWSPYLYHAGQTAMLVRKTRSAGGIDLLSVDLDIDAWTRLITGGLEQGVIHLP